MFAGSDRRRPCHRPRPEHFVGCPQEKPHRPTACGASSFPGGFGALFHVKRPIRAVRVGVPVRMSVTKGRGPRSGRTPRAPALHCMAQAARRAARALAFSAASVNALAREASARG